MFAIGAFFALVLYTTNGCGGTTSSTAPPPAAASVQGTVTSAPNVPIANATVALKQGSTSLSVVTGASGQYRADGLAPGDVTITATAAGFSPYSARIPIGPGMNTYDIRLQPSP